MYKFVIYPLFTLYFLPIVSFAQPQGCSNGTNIFASSVLQNTYKQCNTHIQRKQKKAYAASQFSRLRRLRNSFAKPTWRQIKRGMIHLKKNNCGSLAARFSSCTHTESTSLFDFSSNMLKGACNLEFKQNRRLKLKSQRRTLKKLEPVLGSPFVTASLKEIQFLLASPNCGRGGSDLLSHCSQIVETADGIGKNVYKTLHYAPYLPIFITRDDSKQCQTRRKSGTLIENLGYSGLANPDEAGLRHHYRFSRTCEQLPELFYIECDGSCYEIDEPCGRID